MRLSDESVIEGGHLTPEERIALQAKEIKQLQQENEQLQAQLAESQRRERAARLEVCRRCPDGEIIDGVKHYPCDGCEWRGPQEGEGNAETDNPD